MGMVEDLVMKLESGVATEKEIQQLKEVGWLTPSLEKLHRVDINRCFSHKSVFVDADDNPFPDCEIPIWLRQLFLHVPPTCLKIIITDGVYLIKFNPKGV